jgi:DNA-binding transcriptional LysR family regulator
MAKALRTIDLNLLKVFEAVLRHRRVSTAAKELGVTPSAVSHALARLRRVFEDELFVSGTTGMEPTSRAVELGAEIQASLDRIFDLVERRPFDPACSRSVFSVAACEYAAAFIVPPMVHSITAAAPKVALRIHPLNRCDVVQRLDEGRLNFALGQFGELPTRLRRSTIVREREAILVRAGHPLAHGALSIERLLMFPHVVALFGATDDQSALQGPVWIERLSEWATDYGHRHIAVTVAQFSAVPGLLAESDMVATLPRRLAARAARAGGVVMLELASDPLEVDIQMIWHERSTHDESCQWLMRHVVDVAEA